MTRLVDRTRAYGLMAGLVNRLQRPVPCVESLGESFGGQKGIGHEWLFIAQTAFTCTSERVDV